MLMVLVMLVPGDVGGVCATIVGRLFRQAVAFSSHAYLSACVLLFFFLYS